MTDPSTTPRPPVLSGLAALAELRPARLYSLILGALILFNLALVWLLPVLPCQDLPEHLAYARIFLDYNRPDLAFSRMYQLPERMQPYYSIHLLLAFLARFGSVLFALRLVMSVYVIGMFASFDLLVRACHPVVGDRTSQLDAAPPWTALLGCLLVFGPITCMGFVQFFLCIPLFLLGCAFVLRSGGPLSRKIDLVGLVVCAAALSSLHPVSAGCLLLFTCFHAAFDRNRRTAGAALATVGVVVSVFLVWRHYGELGMGSQPEFDYREAIRGSFGLEFINSLFKITWYDPPVKMNYLLWAVLGPYPPLGMLLVAGAMAFAAWLVHRLAPPAGSLSDGPADGPSPWSSLWSPGRRAFWAFALLSWSAPWGIYRPTELTFLNFRMMGLAFALLVALIPPRRFATKKAHAVLLAFCLFFEAQLGYRAIGFAAESRQTLSLLDQARPRGVMLSLMFHNRSAEFAKMFRVTHFLPMYYTVLAGGVNTQFWAQYIEHLPISYRAGQRTDQPADWQPWEFKADHLRSADYVLFAAADADDTEKMRNDSAQAERILMTQAALVRCTGRICLYRTRRGASLSPESSR